MRMQRICVIGGNGFVGRHLVHSLADRDVQIKLLARRRESAKDFFVLPNVDVCEAHALKTELEDCFSGMDAVINLAGILHEQKPGDFDAVHVALARKIAAACKNSQVSRLLHMSALHAHPGAPSAYLRSKGLGELEVLAAHNSSLQVTVFRPSVIFGREDHFLNLFARLLKLLPVIPLGSPRAKFQPVYVEDVVAVFVASLTDSRTFGQRLDLCGPKVYTLEELVKFVAHTLGLHRYIIPLNDSLSHMQATVFEHLPGKLLTRDNLLSMQIENICASPFPLDLVPRALEFVVPQYLTRERNKVLNNFRSAARR